MIHKDTIQKLDFHVPSGKNGYRFFNEDLEENPNILFHITKRVNLEKIIKDGFKSKSELTGNLVIGPNNLASISFGRTSNLCVSHIQFKFEDDYALLVVDYSNIKDNTKYIKEENDTVYLYSSTLQPKIIGYIEIPTDDEFKRESLSSCQSHYNLAANNHHL